MAMQVLAFAAEVAQIVSCCKIADNFYFVNGTIAQSIISYGRTLMGVTRRLCTQDIPQKARNRIRLINSLDARHFSELQSHA